jgi:hypothetical protein
MNTSCIRHPENTRYIQLHEWQVRFCKGSHCAALILSYFIAWHDWKLRHDQYYRRSNDIAEVHGEGRPYNENAYLFFSTEQLIDGCMGLYGKKAISDGIEFLVSLNVISVHKNPNPRYHFDKTKYFKFYPKICNRWIAENYSSSWNDEENDMQLVDFFDSAKIANRKSENAPPTRKNDRPSSGNSQAITDTTNNTTNKTNSINGCDDFDQNKKREIVTELEEVIDALVAKGLPREKFSYADAKSAIEHLIGIGATSEIFTAAFDLASSATHGNGFGVNYLVKVVESLLKKSGRIESANSSSRVNALCTSKQEPPQPREYVYKHNVKNVESWAGDLI